MCADYVSCFLNSINVGLRLGGGLGDAFTLQADPNSDVYWGRFFVDVTFFVIVRLIFLNLIAGIIIDTFSDLRDELTNRDQDARTVCFICGLTKWQIEKKGQDFQKHINSKHDKWRYMYFMTKLNQEDKDTFNGFEFSVYEKYQKDDTSWFPNKDFLDSQTYNKVIK